MGCHAVTQKMTKSFLLARIVASMFPKYVGLSLLGTTTQRVEKELDVNQYLQKFLALKCVTLSRDSVTSRRHTVLASDGPIYSTMIGCYII